MRLGAHMSIAGGVSKAIDRAQSIGCTALQLFTHSPNRWQDKALPNDEVALFVEKAARFGPEAILAHDNYLINLAAPDPEKHKKSMDVFSDEIIRADQLKIPYLVMHPGSSLDSPREDGITKIADSLNAILEGLPNSQVTVLLETTAGQGSNLGCSFEELHDMLDRLVRPERFGVCVDTCHIFAAGYDITTKTAYEKTFDQFDRIIGLHRLKAFHVNDCKKPLGSRVDRHEQIGKGQIGLNAFLYLMNDPRFIDLPMTLETPKGPDLAEDVENLARLRALVGKERIPSGLTGIL